jgi:hypothetical protein
MGGSAKWIWCGLVVLMGLAGLFVAARSGENPVPYWGGILFFVFAILFTLHQVKTSFDHREQHH